MLHFRDQMMGMCVLVVFRNFMPKECSTRTWRQLGLHLQSTPDILAGVGQSVAGNAEENLSSLRWRLQFVTITIVVRSGCYLQQGQLHVVPLET